MSLRDLETFHDALALKNFREVPVSIDTFVEDPKYLGKATDGGRLIYPCWRKALREMFSDDGKTLIVLTGAIGIGKSTVAVVALAYIVYKLTLLRNPWWTFNLAESSAMAVSFFNLTKGLSSTRGFAKMQAFLQKSYHFQNLPGSTVRGSKFPVMELSPLEWLLSSPAAQGFGTLGADVIAGILDEIDSPTESVKSKQKVVKAYENTFRRFESRFVVRGCSLGKLFIVASKQDEHSFIDVFVEKMKNSGRVLVFDIPLWEAKPSSYFCGRTFPVAVGDAFKPSKLIDAEEDKREYLKRGYKVVDIPIEYRDDFILDIDASLRDIAGITVAGNRKRKLFASERFVKLCMMDVDKKPITQETIHMGLEDDVRLLSYFDPTTLQLDYSVPRYLHMDFGVTGDALGLAMSGISGWTEENDLDALSVGEKRKLPTVHTDFVMRIKAREGDRVPLAKVRQFILDLRRLGINIQKFTADLRLASEDTKQILTKEGIETDYISLDRTAKPYLDFRGMVYEERWTMVHHDIAYFEFKHLEYDPEAKPPVDHPDEVKDLETAVDGTLKDIVREGSKDCADAIVGSVISALTSVQNKMDTELMSDMLQALKGSAEEERKENLLDKFNFTDGSGRKIKSTGMSDGSQSSLSSLFDTLR